MCYTSNTMKDLVKCYKCKKEYKPEDYYPHPYSRSGLRQPCKKCYKAPIGLSDKELDEYFRIDRRPKWNTRFK